MYGKNKHFIDFSDKMLVFFAVFIIMDKNAAKVNVLFFKKIIFSLYKHKKM